MENDCIFHNHTAAEWAKHSQEIEHELETYKNMARVGGLVLLNMFFLFIIFSLPVKKRKRMFPFPSREENKNQDEAENLTQVSTATTTREVHAPISNPSNPSSNPSAFIHSNPILSNGA